MIQDNCVLAYLFIHIYLYCHFIYTNWQGEHDFRKVILLKTELQPFGNKNRQSRFGVGVGIVVVVAPTRSLGQLYMIPCRMIIEFILIRLFLVEE